MGRKGKMMGKYPALLIALFILVAGVVALAALSPKQQAAPQTVTGSGSGQASGGDITILSTTPTLTLTTNDKYNKKTAVTTQNMYQIITKDSSGNEIGSGWTDIAGAGTLQKGPGTVVDFVLGIDTNDESAEPYGESFRFVFPQGELSPQITKYVANDALATDLTDTYFNHNDVADTNITMAAGGSDTMFITFDGSYQEDFGNLDCGKMSNVLVIEYNNTVFDTMTPLTIVESNIVSGSTVLADVSYPIEEVATPDVLSKTSGHVYKAIKFPVIESNRKYKLTYYLKADGTIAPQYDNDITQFKFHLYDSAKYVDGDDNSNVKCGVEDENDAEIGAAAADTITPVIP